MKQLIATLLLTLASTQVFAHPGGNHLVCKSNPNSKQMIEVNLDRSNGVGWFAPVIAVTVNSKKIELTTTNEMNNYGETFHDSPLGVITVSADNTDEKKATATGSFSVVAIPSSVQAFDTDGKRMKWNFQAEKDECYDSNGKTKFKGIFRGYLNSGKTNISIEPQVLDCELDYDSGMAC